MKLVMKMFIVVGMMMGMLFVFPVSAGDSTWLILPGQSFGLITAETAHADLVEIYGEENMVDKAIPLGEGFTKPGTQMFPENPESTFEITWKDEDRTRPERIQVGGQKSHWKTIEGITIGTSLKEIEKHNGAPFILTGFGWDYAGTILNYNEGTLDYLKKKGMMLRLMPKNEDRKLKAYSRTLGDKDFKSSLPAMQRLNPTVYQIIYTFK